MKKVVKVPSMRRFQEYLRRIAACSESREWLKGRNFRTVGESYEFLMERCGELACRREFLDNGVKCCPMEWLRWLFISVHWQQAGNSHVAPWFGQQEYGGANLRIVTPQDLPPPWEKVREYLRFEVNRVVPLDWTPPEE